jgi:hypothetical protein
VESVARAGQALRRATKRANACGWTRKTSSRICGPERPVAWSGLGQTGHGITLKLTPFYGPSEVARTDVDEPPKIHLNLSYRSGGQDVEQSAPIDPLPQHFGGWRPWLRCPDCQRRCKYIYLPPAGSMPVRRFACRQCHGLTYRSCNESHRSDLFIGMIASRCGLSWREARRQLRLEGFAV